jgi:hypothetical protein
MTILKEGPLRKSAVYRIEGIGPDGATVIAKRCERATASRECATYERLLPHLPVSSLRCYGCVEEAESSRCWLFIEDAGPDKYSARSPAHRDLAAQWLAVVHASSAHLTGLAAWLPDAGPARYLHHLQSARDMILHQVSNPAISAADRTVLGRLVAVCDRLERQWWRLEERCAGLPQTLVHGDFVGKNIRVRSGPGGYTLLAFDWGDAGWGVPAVDLAHAAHPYLEFSASPAVPTYCAMMRHRWPGITLHTIEQLASCGTLFRCLAALDWEAHDLAYPWRDAALRHMAVYCAWIEAAVGTMKWRL